MAKSVKAQFTNEEYERYMKHYVSNGFTLEKSHSVNYGSFISTSPVQEEFYNDYNEDCAFANNWVKDNCFF